jgi:ABC-type branched-subunit amino acid transport system substrate-binding protein
MHFNKVRYIVLVVLLIVNCQLSIVNCAYAQVNYQQEYKNAKLLFQEGKYNLAMENFKKIIPYDQANDYSQYASFYYAVAAYKQRYYSVSKDMLNQIKMLYPNWEKIEDVNYWLALNLLETGEIFQGIKTLNTLKDKKLQSQAALAKENYIKKIADVETLRMLNEENPKDDILAKALAVNLSKNIASVADREELEKLISDFKLDRNEFIKEAPKSYFKDVYSVALVFPFVINRLDPSPAKKPNQFVLDMYQGILLAKDTLEKQGIKISLRTYDTERNQEKLKSILEKDELKNADLVIGPLLREDNALMQEFSAANKVNTFNPLSNDFDMVRQNPFGFLFQPSYEVLGQKTARYLSQDLLRKKKKCIVFYGSNVRDSVLAWNFITKAEEAGIKIILKQEVFKEESNKITDVLAKATEYDEWKAPSQFTIPKDSLGAIFVASDDPVIYTKVVSAVETRKDNTLILGSEVWLENGSIDLAKFQRMNFVLYAPNYVATNNKAYEAFNRQFIKKYGRTPSSLSLNYARTGYEMMIVLGNGLHKYGVYLQDGFNKEVQTPFMMTGFDFRYSNFNQTVPFVKFLNGSLEVIATY